MNRHIWQAALLFLVLGLLLKILAIQFAAVHWDSNYYLNTGSNFIERGELTPYMWRLGADTNIISGGGPGYGVLLLNYWFKAFGLSLLSGYVFMYLAGLLSLVVLYFLARDWWGGEAAGIGAVVVVALTQAFTEIFYLRFDVVAILAYSVILWLHLHVVRSRRNWLHFVMGVVLVAALEVHILASLYTAGISLYYALWHYRTARTQRRLWLVTPAIYYFAGLTLAGSVYLLIHVLPDPYAYFLLPRECPVCQPASPIKELKRYRLLLELRGVETLLFVIALTAANLRREKADRHYLIIVFGYFVALTVSSPPISEMYMTHLLPLIGLGAGGAWMKGISPGEVFNDRKMKMGVAVACFMLVNQLLVVVIAAPPPAAPDGVEYVRAYVPEDTVVIGLPSIYHYLIKYDRFLSYHSGERYGILLRDEDYPTFWERERPQVFVGEPDSDDDEWWAYMRAHDFRQVRDDVWVEANLLQSISAGIPIPEASFVADKTKVDIGDCVELQWSVTNTDSVTLNDDTVEQVGIEQVCPNFTTDYTLSTYWVGGVKEQTITVNVE